MLKIDARPSDSIALALRTDARISVAKKVLESTSQAVPKEEGGEDLWKEVLESMEDDDFGKYKM